MDIMFHTITSAQNVGKLGVRIAIMEDLNVVNVVDLDRQKIHSINK